MFYGWAEKNTRPQVQSNEKKRRNKINGMLCVDAVSGEEYLKFREKSKTEDVSSYMLELCLDCWKKGISTLSVILDNNSTHKQKMQSQLQSHLLELDLSGKIEVEFIYTPPYSPDFNLVEYIIHLLRLRFLHHLPLNTTIHQVKEKLETYFQSSQLQTPQQIQNTLRHILNLVK
jgi:transposase